MVEQETPKKRNWNWVLWWRVDEAELEEQVAGYYTLSIWKAARKLSVLCLALSMVLTMALVAFKVIPLDGIFDATLFAILAAFIYFGHRWAMIAAMLLWTFEKFWILFTGLGDIKPGAGSVGQLIWWAVYMHVFWLAFRTEQRRKALLKSPATV